MLDKHRLQKPEPLHHYSTHRIRSALSRWLAPGSLRSQLLSRSLFVLALLLLLLGILQYAITKDFLYRSNADAMKAQLLSMPKQVLVEAGIEVERDQDKHSIRSESSAFDKPSSDRGTVQEPDRGHLGRPPLFLMPDASLAAIDSNGRFVDLSGAYGVKPPQLSMEEYKKLGEERRMQAPTTYEIVTAADGTEQLVVFSPIGPPSKSAGLLQMGVKTETLQTMLQQQLLIFIALAVLALASGLLLYLPLLRRLLGPLSRVVTAVERTDAGNLSTRLPTAQGQREIDQLALSFNGMLERLEASFQAEKVAVERMRQFVADASHELRTPLTSIHGFLEVLLRGASTKPEQLQASLRSMHSESTRMNKLVADLLLLAKLEEGTAPQERTLQLADVRLDQLLDEMEPQLSLLAGQRTLRLELNTSKSVKGNADQLKQVVLNLVHNAVQHTDPLLGTLTISLSAPQAGYVELSLKDNGSGIAPEHLVHIFDRFYRSDSSRTRKYGGAGLGLSISRAIVEAHGGTLSVESKLSEGSIFYIRLPLLDGE